MKASRIAAWMAVGTLALGAGACGGSSDDGDSGATAPATTETTASTTATTETTSSGGLTAPGTKLGLGEAATVGWVPPSNYSSTAAQKGFKIELTVDKIEKGTLDDLKNIQLDDEQKGSIPYFVTVTVKALENVDPGTDDPDTTLDAIDDRGQDQGKVIFLGEFERCDDTDVPRPFAKGKSYTSCLTFLMPGGGSIEEIHWRSGPSRANEVTPYFGDPVVWSGS